jgi:hypothetical protein
VGIFAWKLNLVLYDISEHRRRCSIKPPRA